MPAGHPAVHGASADRPRLPLAGAARRCPAHEVCKALDRARTSALKSVQQLQQEARAQQDVAAVLAAEAQQAQTATLKAEVETAETGEDRQAGDRDRQRARGEGQLGVHRRSDPPADREPGGAPPPFRGQSLGVRSGSGVSLVGKYTPSRK